MFPHRQTTLDNSDAFEPAAVWWTPGISNRVVVSKSDQEGVIRNPDDCLGYRGLS